jgi:hypothetical protein
MWQATHGCHRQEIYQRDNGSITLQVPPWERTSILGEPKRLYDARPANAVGKRPTVSEDHWFVFTLRSSVSIRGDARKKRVGRPAVILEIKPNILGENRVP